MALTRRKLGIVLTQPLELVLVSDHQVPDILIWGEQFTLLGVGNMTRRESELLPDAYMRVDGPAWRPFIQHCVLARKFRPLPASARR